MPGAYTHISLARLLTSDNSLSDLNLHDKSDTALKGYKEFCQMGAISPDYPYLDFLRFDNRTASEHWANAMHHKYSTLTEKNILHVGIDYIKGLTGDEQLQCLAWFFGYASHVTADVTCHPMTNLLVGDYDAGNKTKHRESEMHQDAYIFAEKVGGNIGESELIKDVIGACGSAGNDKKINPSIEKMWRTILSEAFPGLVDKFKININDWHNSILFWIDNVAEELYGIPSRHVRDIVAGKGVAYPTVVDRSTFIDQLKTPGGIKTYEEVFDLASDNAGKVWGLISDGIFEGKTDYLTKLKIWNLDTGREVKTPIVLWEDGAL